MKIVIVGGGKVGYAIAGEVSGEGHDVTIIDHNPANYERLSLGLDCMTILGDGNSLEALRAANAGESDLLIAATPSWAARIPSPGSADGSTSRRWICCRRIWAFR